MIENDGYMYDDNGITMHEFHVDDIQDSHDLPELRTAKMGGRLSVRRDTGAKQLISWGQDEVVCHGFQMQMMTWYGSDGSSEIRPKDKGPALHISGIKSREAGFHCKPTPHQLKTINRSRVGNKYFAEEAAIEVKGSAWKQPLSELDIEEKCFRW